MREYADLYDKERNRRDKVASISDSLPTEDVIERYIYNHEDEFDSSPEWLVDLWYDMVEQGVITFEDYSYDGREWESEPVASLDINDNADDGDFLVGWRKGLRNSEFKNALDKYMKNHPELEMTDIDDEYFAIQMKFGK